VPRSPKTIVVVRSEAPLYLAKAQEFLQAARTAAGEKLADAVVLDAIHAAISAADAVAVALGGRRSADPDHQRAVDLLEEIAGSSGEIKGQVRQLRSLLAKKNAVEYESRRASAKEASDAMQRAERFVGWAAITVQRAKV
jgi:hypothetical protein